MAQFRSGSPSKKVVWRITPEAPAGEYVDPAMKPKAKPEPVKEKDSGWVLSSFDLLTGLDIIEGDGPTPQDLFDEAFKKPVK